MDGCPTLYGCPTLLANDGYFGQACTLFYFYSCLFCQFKLIKGANKVVVVVAVVVVGCCDRAKYQLLRFGEIPCKTQQDSVYE